MAKISKNKPLKEMEDLMWGRLIEVFRDAKNDEAVKKVLDDLLTPSEKIIFGKRLTIVLLLSRGLSYQEISNLLKVSSGTITHIQNALRRKGDGYNEILKLEKTSKSDQISSRLEKILNNLSFKSGPGR